MAKAKPIMNQLEWMASHEMGGTPKVFVNVWNCRARIMVEKDGQYEDVTDQIRKGTEMAEEAVYAFGGAINMSGWYPPTDKILKALKRKGLI